MGRTKKVVALLVLATACLARRSSCFAGKQHNSVRIILLFSPEGTRNARQNTDFVLGNKPRDKIAGAIGWSACKKQRKQNVDTEEGGTE